MAGAGFKTFASGEVLTAANVNTYLMQQTVMVFADSSARSTALGASVSEGMLSYLKDTNQVEVYNGSAWVASDDPNAIQNTIVDAKGDLISATAADTPARLAVGTDGQVLTADSTTATGLKWATAASGGMTLLSTTTLSGATVNINSISQSYKDLKIVIYGVTLAADDTPILRFRNSTTNQTNRYQAISNGIDQGIFSSQEEIYLAPDINQYNNTGGVNSYEITLTDYTATTAYARSWIAFGIYNNGANTNDSGMQYGSIIDALAVNSVQIAVGGTTFNGGTVKIWGIS